MESNRVLLDGQIPIQDDFNLPPIRIISLFLSWILLAFVDVGILFKICVISFLFTMIAVLGFFLGQILRLYDVNNSTLRLHLYDCCIQDESLSFTTCLIAS
ncbi:unnamed protein product [Citrullus colocynthis]|uniref:Uncharacterized protein n=1 Tax=Citrullus colocynthis TaxID=252529 RepID=A0ABP0XP94_9ROSI